MKKEQKTESYAILVAFKCDVDRFGYVASNNVHFLECNLLPTLKSIDTLSKIHQSSYKTAQAHAVSAATHLFNRWELRSAVLSTTLSRLKSSDIDMILKMMELVCSICFTTVPEILEAVDCSIQTINAADAVEGHTNSTLLTKGYTQ